MTPPLQTAAAPAVSESPVLDQPFMVDRRYGSPEIFEFNGFRIVLDNDRDALLTSFGKKTLSDRYLLPGETYQRLFGRVACAYADDAVHAQRVYDYMSKLWFMPATPVLSNGGAERGLPISCFLNDVGDSLDEIVATWVENVWLAAKGGGIGTYWGNVREIGARIGQVGESSGLIPFITVQDRLTLAISQGSLRRGSAAVYLPIWHPEIEEFLEIRKASGDFNRKALNLHNGVVISDAFMEAVRRGDKFPLVSPKDGRVTKEVDARLLFQKLIELRIQTGEPYIIYIDTVNRYLADHQKKLGLKVKMSNLCTEIFLHTGPDHLGRARTAVCCLSSINLETYEQWKNEATFVEDLLRFLDNVLEDFIRRAPDTVAEIRQRITAELRTIMEEVLARYLDAETLGKAVDECMGRFMTAFEKELASLSSKMARARYSAMRERSVGLGVMGFHSFLQSKMIPFESAMAKAWNLRIFKDLRAKADAASVKLAHERGPCPDAAEVGVMERFSHKLSIAPTASISIICGGASPAIEPWSANTFTHKTLSGSEVVRNPYLVKLLEEKGQNTQDVWTSIVANEGSVTHLDFLDADEKAVFKTAFELDQRWLIEFAADRTPYICQGQSLNLFLPADIDKWDLLMLHWQAWEKGVKSLYYCRSKSVQRAAIAGGVEADNTKAHRVIEAEVRTNYDECLSCQ